ncbi:MAG: Mov34/MPN/PAD-1 family protein [Candidatus Hodarchaeota archaeon]
MTSDKTIIIKPLAYYKMLIHVLRFGSKVRDRKQYKEVMGILIGRLEGDSDKKGIKDVIVEDAVPISHGGSIEVAFAPEDYVTFSMVDAEFAEKGWFSVGWYHSHPGLKIFFSSTDIKNMLGWQVPNPSAIGIVFDHTFLEKPGDLGFRAFRLDDPSKGQTTGYHEIRTVVEPPDSLEYYQKLIELINSIHSKEPPILEINELPDLFGDIAIPSQEQLITKKPELELTVILSAIQRGLSGFLEMTIEPFITFLNVWSQEMIRKTIESNLEMRNNLLVIKERIGSGISKIQKDFKFSLKDKLNQLDMYIDDKFDDFDKNIQNLKEIISQVKIELNDKLKVIFEENLKVSLDQGINSIKETLENLTKINQESSNAFEKLKSEENSLNNISEKINSIEDVINNKLKNLQDELINKLSKNINKIVGNFINLNKDTKSFLSDLKAAIILLESSKNPIQNKITTLESENKTLQKDLLELKNQNQDLINKLQKYEGGD